ncbi:uncharacterized protein LOC110441451 [Mizuhopecten yessoensis]|uniref:Uncharacterized protein n=1 Tax=Mizuhopecten yessoensis TaxID=6573 RepID=A0A210PJD2_MIZYE|nr:uncharacterized protein LOC110441451 [Mizuhopecten yessoensis]XP_021340274.1 uncharacterized protein LOC110441451 [Mizuhopecten yessoensis]OWF36601.1 hypothetical protein KP79_PYT03074 [Mizuhopecten yessoensis]
MASMDSEASEVNTTDVYDVLFDVSACSTNVTSYIYAFIGLACLAFISVVVLVISNILQRKKLGKNYVDIISGFAVIQLCYCLVNTVVIFLHQLGHCGWVYQTGGMCKFMWWLKHTSFVSGNYILVLICTCSKLLFVEGKSDTSRSLPVVIGFWVIVLVSGLFDIPYLIFTEVVNGIARRDSDVISISYCHVGAGHTNHLEIIEFCFGTLLPAICAFLSLIPHFLGAWTRFDKGIMCYFRRTTEDKHDGDGGVDVRKRLDRYFSKCLTAAVFMHVLLLVPQRLFEFVNLLSTRPSTLPTVGVKNASEMSPDAWNTFIAMFTMFPLIYSIFTFPIYHALAGNPFKCFACFGMEKSPSRQLQRRKPVRHIAASETADTYFQSVTSDEFASNF